MKILIFAECPYTPNSLGKITYYISKGLKDRGHEVVNVCLATFTSLWEMGQRWKPKPSQEPLTRKIVKNENALKKDFGEFVIYPWIGKLERYVMRFNPDVIFLYGTPFAPPVSEVLKECKSKNYICAGYFLNESLILIPEYALHAANAVAFATPSEYVRRTFIDGFIEGGVPEDIVRDRTMTVYHGIDPYPYLIDDIDPAVQKDEKLVTIGTFYKNHVRKDTASLVEAFARMDDDAYRRARLFLPMINLAGDQSWDLELLIRYVSMLTKRRDIYEKVVAVADEDSNAGVTEWGLARIYKSMDVFAFPSRGEAFGLPPLEAGYMGLPVVVTSHPVLMEIWGGLPKVCKVPARPWLDKSAFGLVQPDVTKLKKSLEKLVLDEKLRKVCGNAAKEIASKYTVDRMVKGIERLLELARDIGRDPMNNYLKVEGGKK